MQVQVFLFANNLLYIDNRQLIVFLPVSSFSCKLCVDNAATPGGISDSVTLNNSSSVVGANESLPLSLLILQVISLHCD